MNLEPIFLGTTTLAISLLILENYTKKEDSNITNIWVHYLFLVGFVISLYPSTASLLTEGDKAYKRLDKNTIVAVSMLSQFLIILGFSLRKALKGKIHAVATAVILLLGIYTVMLSF